MDVQITFSVVTARSIGRSEIAVCAAIVFASSWRDKKATFEEWMSPLRLSGMIVPLLLSKSQIPKQIPPMKKGALFIGNLRLDTLEYLLNCAASDRDPDLQPISLDIFPVTEPCVRVPISVLKELRGQEGTIEAARSALVGVWNRKIGESNDCK